MQVLRYSSFRHGFVLVVASTLLILSGATAHEPPEIAARLPDGETWLAHAVRDVLPYWSSPEALGDPVGRFPTFRYADGEPIDADELLRPDHRWIAEGEWIGSRLDRSYTRMISRQAWVLVMGFHLTGDGRYLAWAEAAVDHILNDLQDGDGSLCSWIARGVCAPAPPHRTAQDLAYALLGPAAYAYVTHDAEMVARLVEIQRHLFAAYRDESTGLLRWVLEAYEDPPDRHGPEQVELVAQLDQINAHMLLLAPLVPDPEAARFRQDLLTLARLLAERFYDPAANVFWGRIDEARFRRLGGHHHTDTGHTAKAFWMLSLVARLAGDGDMGRLAREGGLRLLEGVFIAGEGTWASGFEEDGSPTGRASWWAHAELNQLAATLALTDPQAARHLPRTYDFWLTHFVDHRHGGIWSSPGEPGAERSSLKAFLWKNGYHSMEHALVAYLTANALRGESVTLYFAPAQGDKFGNLRPYYFDGRAEIVRRLPLLTVPGRERLEVRFIGVE